MRGFSAIMAAQFFSSLADNALLIAACIPILLFLVPKLAFADSLADEQAEITASASADRV